MYTSTQQQNIQNNPISQNRNQNSLKLKFGLASALVMVVTAFTFFQAEVLQYAWAQAILVLIAGLGGWLYLSVRRSRRGKRLSYFRIYSEAISVSMISFLVFGGFIFAFLQWIADPQFLATISPAAAALGTVFGGAFLSTILAFIALPFFRRVNPENGI